MSENNQSNQSNQTEQILLSVKNLHTSFKIHKKRVEAIRGIDIHVNHGEILAVVGESGSGKSVSMKSILGILGGNAVISADEMQYKDKDMLSLSKKEHRLMRGEQIAMIFQDPMTALNPVKKIGDHLTDVICRHQRVSKKQAVPIAIDALKKVGIPSPETRLKQYPHEFSGGMRQRVMIAMALCCKPGLLIADEPTTALDVTIQAQVLELLQKLQKEEDMSIVLITHDLGVVASVSNRISVMYGGYIMEEGLTDEIFYQPSHPYTRALLRAIPRPVDGEKERLVAIPGSAPSLHNMPTGCPFAERCAYTCEKCKTQIPSYRLYSDTQRAACIYTKEELEKMGDVINGQ